MVNSGFLNSLPLFAIVTGSLAGGMVSDWVLTVTGSRRWARQGVASSCMLICSVFVLAASTIRDPLLAVGVIPGGGRLLVSRNLLFVLWGVALGLLIAAASCRSERVGAAVAALLVAAALASFWSSTRVAARRRAISRRAVRLPGRKNRWMARAA